MALFSDTSREAVLGLSALQLKLEKLDQKTAAKAVRGAAVKAVSPVKAKMKAKIPVGDEAHRLYTGRLVSGGFAKRSVKHLSKVKYGKVHIWLGTNAEAFYAGQWYDNPISSRRGGARAHRWMQAVFDDNEKNMVDTFAREVAKKLDNL